MGACVVAIFAFPSPRQRRHHGNEGDGDEGGDDIVVGGGDDDDDEWDGEGGMKGEGNKDISEERANDVMTQSQHVPPDHQNARCPSQHLHGVQNQQKRYSLTVTVRLQ